MALRDTDSIAYEKGDILQFYDSEGIAVLPRDSEFFNFGAIQPMLAR